MTTASTIAATSASQERSCAPDPWRLALLSASSSTALGAGLDALRAQIQRGVDQAVAMIRVHPIDPGSVPHRGALLFKTATDDETTKTASTSVAGGDPRPVALMLPGLGDHYVNMGRDLYGAQPAFREQVDRCAEILQPELGIDLRDVIYPSSKGAKEAPPGAPEQGIDLRRMLRRDQKEPSANEARLNQTRLAQPALFVIEYALAKLWQSWGLRPDAMIGYSLGEYVAACLAGVLSLEDSLTLVARRAQMIEELPDGAMVAVSLPEEQVLPLLGERLSVAAVNGPDFCVVAGPPEEVHALERRLSARGTTTRRVQSSHAFHSRMMAPIAERVTRLVATYALRSPEIPYLSNVTGAFITAAQATDPAYWATHLCQPVRFADGIGELLEAPRRILLEVGPGQTLSSLVLQRPNGELTQERVVVPSMRHAYDVQADTAVLLKAVSRLWLADAALEWERFPSAPLTVARGAEGKGAHVEQIEPATADIPSTETERELAAIWKKVISAERIGRDANFFDLGGNSLIATRLISRVLKAFRVTLPLRRIYDMPTLALMAADIDKRRAGKEGEGATAARAAQPGPRSAAGLRGRLPNGLDITHQNQAETRHFYEDIFVHRSYVKHGIRLPKGACVFDVGANIGLFTLFISTEAKDAHIFSFEPAPPLFEIVRRNVAEHHVNATLFNYGLSDREREASFTFYPRSSGMSSFHADREEEKHVLRTIIENQRRSRMPEMDQVDINSEELLDVRFEAQTFTAKLRRLSDVLREQGVERIDLLKIDVQKCEMEVIEGIDETDWPKIEQIVLEVHDVGGRVSALSALLERRGFSVIAEQDSLYVGTNIHNIYAVRDRR